MEKDIDAMQIEKTFGKIICTFSYLSSTTKANKIPSINTGFIVEQNNERNVLLVEENSLRLSSAEELDHKLAYLKQIMFDITKAKTILSYKTPTTVY